MGPGRKLLSMDPSVDIFLSKKEVSGSEMGTGTKCPSIDPQQFGSGAAKWKVAANFKIIVQYSSQYHAQKNNHPLMWGLFFRALDWADAE